MTGRALIALAAGALVLATSASSRPAAGINVTVAPVMVALKDFDEYSGVATLAYVTAARWSPEALREDVDITIKDVTEGAEAGARAGDAGSALHSSNRYSDLAPGFAGHRMEFSARWNVYNVGGDSGVGVSGTTKYVVPKKEPAPRLEHDEKVIARTKAREAFGECAAIGATAAVAVILGAVPVAAALGVAAALNCAIGEYFNRMANDPIDMNFRSIAKPKIPAVPKVSAGEGLPAAAARALNDLFAVQAREIGFARVIATALDRSQGAHVKKAIAWEKKQVRAAGTYASQLASALLAEATLRPKVKAALAGSGLGEVTVPYEEAFAFGESLVWKGLPADMAASLTKFGVTKAEQREARAQVATIDPGIYEGIFLSAIANPLRLRSIRELAAGLKAFAKKAAKTPLATRPP